MGNDGKDLRQCPVCGQPIGLLSRNENYISIGCDNCHLSRSVTHEEWNRANDADQDPPEAAVGDPGDPPHSMS
jgi:hypothetical protein